MFPRFGSSCFVFLIFESVYSSFGSRNGCFSTPNRLVDKFLVCNHVERANQLRDSFARFEGVLAAMSGIGATKETVAKSRLGMNPVCVHSCSTDFVFVLALYLDFLALFQFIPLVSSAWAFCLRSWSIFRMSAMALSNVYFH